MEALAQTADVLEARAGDRMAYARLVDRHRNAVASIALAIVRDLPASEDVAQEVFLAAWSGLKRLRNPASFLPWLRQLARNHAYDFLRHKRRAPLHPAQEELLAAAADPQASALEHLTSAEERELVFRAIEALPDETREVVLLYYREGQSAAQVAELLSLREDAVKKRLSRARDILREAMSIQLGEALDRSKPGAGFTAAVISGLPPAGSAIAAGASLKAAAKAGGAKLAVLLGGAALGAVTGISGALLGSYFAARQALDDRERRELWRVGFINSAGVIFFSVGIAVERTRGAPIWCYWATYSALIAILFWGTQLQLPKIIARRTAHELATDPTAAARHRRRRLIGFGAMLIGGICGAIGLAEGLRH